MTRILLSLVLWLAWPAMAENANVPASAPAAPATAAPAKSNIDERITRLTSARDPFWPPDYAPGGDIKPAPEEPTDDLGLLALREGAKLNPQGRIKVGNKYLLMIKGRAVAQGDVIDVTGKNGKTFKMRIIAISQDNIQLEPVGP